MSTPNSPTDSTPRFERPLADRRVSGVCAAVARHQRIDVTLVRAITIVLMAAGGIGFIAYFAGLLLIPSEGVAEPLIREGIDGPERNKVIVLGLAAAIAVFGLGEGPFGFFGVFNGTPWPLVAVLAVVGAVVVMLRRERSEQPASVGAPATAATVGPPSGPEAVTEVMPTAAMAAATSTTPRRRGRSGLILGGVLLALAGAGAILAATGDSVRWDIALCASVIAIGVLLVAAAPFGGARVVAPIGILLAVLAGGAAAADLNLRGGVGDQIVHPATLRADNSYHQAIGRLTVDLRDVTLPPGLTTVHAEIGFGQLVVRVPDGVRVELAAHTSAGNIEAFGRESNGLDARRSGIVGAVTAGPSLKIDAHTGFGQIRVLNANDSLPPRYKHPHDTKGPFQ